MRENRTQGSARGLPGNGQFYLNLRKMNDNLYKYWPLVVTPVVTIGIILISGNAYDSALNQNVLLFRLKWILIWALVLFLSWGVTLLKQKEFRKNHGNQISAAYFGSLVIAFILIAAIK